MKSRTRFCIRCGIFTNVGDRNGGQCCSKCGMVYRHIPYVSALILLIGLLLVGCNENRKPHKPKDTPVVIIAEQTAATIHRKSAQVRAEAYDKLADAIESGSVKTVNEAMNFTNPMFQAAGEQYVIAINSLRKSRLHDADDVLPADAAATFRQFAAEYREAAK